MSININKFRDSNVKKLECLDVKIASIPYCATLSKYARTNQGKIESAFNTKQFRGISLIGIYKKMTVNETPPSPDEYCQKVCGSYCKKLDELGINPDSKITESCVIDEKPKDFFLKLPVAKIPTHRQYGFARAIKTFPELVAQYRSFYQYCCCSRLVARGLVLPLSSEEIDFGGADFLVCRKVADKSAYRRDYFFVCVGMATNTQNGNDHYDDKQTGKRSQNRIASILNESSFRVRRELYKKENLIGDIYRYDKSFVDQLDEFVDVCVSNGGVVASYWSDIVMRSKLCGNEKINEEARVRKWFVDLVKKEVNCIVDKNR